MARAMWQGSINFGLVQIPVGLYTAEESKQVSFHLLDRRDMAPIGYKRINKHTGEEVSSEDIVKGHEYRKGDYVVLTDEDFNRIRVEATRSIDIMDFVDRNAIEQTRFDRPYYVSPSKQGRKAYVLLRETLKRTNKVGIAKVVLRQREHLAAVLAQGDALVLELLRFDDELRDTSELDLPGEEDLKKLHVNEREIDMAEQLIEGMTAEWDPKQYHDEYREGLVNLIEERASAGELNRVVDAGPAPEAPKPEAKVIDLMSLLKRSLDQQQRKPAKHAPRAKNDEAKNDEVKAETKHETKHAAKHETKHAGKRTTTHRRAAKRASNQTRARAAH